MGLHHAISRLMAPGGTDDAVACDPVFRLDCDWRGLGCMLEQSSFAGKDSAGANGAEVSHAKQAAGTRRETSGPRISAFHLFESRIWHLFSVSPELRFARGRRFER